MILKTQIIEINPQLPEDKYVKIAADLLIAGKLVAFPTETVYGLGANAFDAVAVEKIFSTKGRPAADPLIVHIGEIEQLIQAACDIPELAWILGRAFWPGPLTLILKRHPDIPDNVTSGMNTIAVRWPAHPVPQAILSVAKIPIAAPSANLFSHVSPTTAQHVIDDLDGKIDLILDGGVCPIGVESTVVDLISSPPVIRRPGGTPWEELVKYLPDILKRPDDEVTRDEPGLRSPGLYEKHYAPRAIFVLVQGEASLAIEMVMTLIKENLKRGAKIGILAYTEDLPGYAEFNVVKKDLGGEDHPEIVASRLYSAMRELDQENVDLIMARDIKQEGLGLAIHDRLVRAAAGKIVSTG